MSFRNFFVPTIFFNFGLKKNKFKIFENCKKINKPISY